VEFWRRERGKRKMASKDHDELLAALHEVVAASNRTNHAVRAIVLPSTILLVAVIVSVPSYLLSLWVGAPLGVLAGLMLLAGAVLAVVAQLKETKASQIPGTEKLLSAPQPVKSTPEATAEPASANEPPSSDSSGQCRFCGKPFAPGVYDNCADCGKN
jgi:hypothetical protein